MENDSDALKHHTTPWRTTIKPVFPPTLGAMRSPSRCFTVLVVLPAIFVVSIHGFQTSPSCCSVLPPRWPKTSSSALVGRRFMLQSALDDVTSQPATDEKERLNGLLVLTTVPFAWGTFEPAVRYVYAMDPPLPAFIFSTAYYLVAAVTLLSAAAVGKWKDSNENMGYGQPPATEEEPVLWPLRAGTELGLYLFLGNAFQVLGLRTIEADRAAFLLQLTTIFVPLLQRNVSWRIWGTCLLALLGVLVMGLEGKEGTAVEAIRSLLSPTTASMVPIQEMIPSFGLGDVSIVAAAIMYSFHCIRLEIYAKSTRAIQLAASKACAETILSAFSAVLFVLSAAGGEALATSSNSFLTFCQESGQEIVKFVESMNNGISNGSLAPSQLVPSGLAILWTGWITCGYTIYAQSYGQRRVRPVTANLIYTIQPICTAMFAWLLLGETLAPAGFIGGSLIATAVLIVAMDEKS